MSDRANLDDVRRRLRAALTWRESLLADAPSAERAQAARAVTLARREVDRALHAAERRAASARAALKSVQADAAAGRGEPEALNRTHRRLSAEKDALEHERADLAALRAAETAGSAGGRLEAPPKELARIAGRARRVAAGWPLRLAAAGCCAVALAALAFPWAEAAGVRSGILTLGRVLIAAGVMAPPAADALPWLAMLYIVVPLAAALAFVGHCGLASAWGVYAAGALMAAGAFLPAFVLGSRSPDAAARLMALPLTGAWVYLAAGAGFMVLAERLRDRATSHRETRWTDFAGALGLVLLAFGLVAGSVAAVPHGGRLLVRPADANGDALAFEVTNERPAPVSLHVAGPAAGERLDAAKLDAGMRRANGEVEPLPPDAQSWRVAGSGALLDGAVELAPGGAATLLLDAAPLRTRYEGGEVSLRLLGADGTVLASAVAPVPPAAAATAMDAPAPVERVTSQSDTEAPPETGDASAPEAPGQTAPAMPALELAFRGVVGDTALFELRVDTEARPEQVRVRIGQPVVGGWRLARLDGRPVEAVLVHDERGELARVARGDTVSLRPERAVSP